MEIRKKKEKKKLFWLLFIEVFSRVLLLLLLFCRSSSGCMSQIWPRFRCHTDGLNFVFTTLCSVQGEFMLNWEFQIIAPPLPCLTFLKWWKSLWTEIDGHCCQIVIWSSIYKILRGLVRWVFFQTYALCFLKTTSKEISFFVCFNSFL